jgi:hypothetical protein
MEDSAEIYFGQRPIKSLLDAAVAWEATDPWRRRLQTLREPPLFRMSQEAIKANVYRVLIVTVRGYTETSVAVMITRRDDDTGVVTVSSLAQNVDYGARAVHPHRETLYLGHDSRLGDMERCFRDTNWGSGTPLRELGLPILLFPDTIDRRGHVLVETVYYGMYRNMLFDGSMHDGDVKPALTKDSGGLLACIQDVLRISGSDPM